MKWPRQFGRGRYYFALSTVLKVMYNTTMLSHRFQRYTASLLAVAAAAIIAAAGVVHAAPYIGLKGYRIDTPAGWIVKPNVGTADLVLVDPAPADLPPTISIVIEPGPKRGDPARTLTKLAKGSTDALKSGTTHFKLVEQKEMMLGGGAAISNIANYDAEGTPATAYLHQIYAVHGTSQYIVTLIVDDKQKAKYEPVFDDFLNSFTYGSLNGQPYISPDGYQITPPADWTVRPVESKHQVYLIEQGAIDFGANVLVTVRPALSTVSAEKLYENRKVLNEQLYPSVLGFKVVQQKIGTVAGEKCLDTIIESQQRDARKTRLRHVIVPHGGNLYEIMTMSLDQGHDKYDKLFQSIIDTFTWSSQAPAAANGSDHTAAPPAP